MSGKILQRARKDANRILNSGGFEEIAILTHPSGSPAIEIKGIHSKHWKTFDVTNSSGFISSKNAHICFSEKDLNEALYPVRNQKTGNVNLINHKVTVPDSTELNKSYVITEAFPSETLGLIVCILSDSE